MRSREWIEARAEINDLVREAREIEHMFSAGPIGDILVSSVS